MATLITTETTTETTTTATATVYTLSFRYDRKFKIEFVLKDNVLVITRAENFKTFISFVVLVRRLTRTGKKLVIIDNAIPSDWYIMLELSKYKGYWSNCGEVSIPTYNESRLVESTNPYPKGCNNALKMGEVTLTDGHEMATVIYSGNNVGGYSIYHTWFSERLLTVLVGTVFGPGDIVFNANVKFRDSVFKDWYVDNRHTNIMRHKANWEEEHYQSLLDKGEIERLPWE